MSEYWNALSEQFNSLPNWAKAAIGAVVVGVPTYLLLVCNKKRPSPIKTDFKPGVVYLYQFPRSGVIPSISPFALKLETWLRLADVNYENVEINPLTTRSKYGQLPFIELDGIEYADSGLIIKELTTRLKKESLDAHLTNEQKGAARAFEQMIENTTLWTYGMVRYMEKFDEMFSEKILGQTVPFFFRLPMMKWSFQNSMKKRMYAHGIGRHTRDEIISIGFDDLKAISTYLGTKRFFMGDQPTRVDATLFGSLAQMIYIPITTPAGDYIKAECQNLVKYCDRVKEKFWPDWQEILENKSLNTWKNKKTA
jgi:glutathione S-transferase